MVAAKSMIDRRLSIDSENRAEVMMPPMDLETKLGTIFGVVSMTVGALVGLAYGPEIHETITGQSAGPSLPANLIRATYGVSLFLGGIVGGTVAGLATGDGAKAIDKLLRFNYDTPEQMQEKGDELYSTHLLLTGKSIE